VGNTAWRPPPIVRPIAVGVVRRGDELLLMAVRTDDGAIAGWRPLGGTIEFGERAADALKREFVEELGAAIAEPRLLSVIENLYIHNGTAGHEIMFVFTAQPIDHKFLQTESFAFDDGGMRNEVRWVPMARFRTGEERLFPPGLLEQIDGAGAG